MNNQTPLHTPAAFATAIQMYADLGVDVEQAIQTLSNVAISLHCWQGDDVQGFESSSAALGGGLAVTGNYPGRARSIAELRSDIEQALALIPGSHRLNLHASYGEFDGAVANRNELSVDQFRGWMDWAKDHGLGLDFNPTYFSHPLAADGWTLAHTDINIRKYWIEHGIACRKIAAAMGSHLGTTCIHNVWIPDGCKENPIDRLGPRQRLMESLDRIFADSHPKEYVRDSVECKLFGIGSESYVVGSHEFYLGYAITRDLLLCLDAGHFHPTESLADKISSTLLWIDELLLHVSRGVRWDSDHVVIFNDDLMAIAQKLCAVVSCLASIWGSTILMRVSTEWLLGSLELAIYKRHCWPHCSNR